MSLERMKSEWYFIKARNYNTMEKGGLYFSNFLETDPSKNIVTDALIDTSTGEVTVRSPSTPNRSEEFSRVDIPGIHLKAGGLGTGYLYIMRTMAVSEVLPLGDGQSRNIRYRPRKIEIDFVYRLRKIEINFVYPETAIEEDVDEVKEIIRKAGLQPLDKR